MQISCSGNSMYSAGRKTRRSGDRYINVYLRCGERQREGEDYEAFYEENFFSQYCSYLIRGTAF